ncbi:hypothetical protein [Blastopirellula marina]|uniref:hypothetical protein n=1 Tax=Blastopirellula marina TaxID=124 RepID=UPI00103E2982|nr:hypothetical protein [Blastopirellula marina]
MLAIGRQVGLLWLLFFFFVAGFIAPAILKNAWLRMGIAFGISGGSIWMMQVFLHSALVDEFQSPLSALTAESLPSSIFLGLIAVATSSLLRWSVLAVTWRHPAIVNSAGASTKE